MGTITYSDLLDEISGVSMDGYCDVPGYTRWEQKIAQPALEAKGWTVHRWETGEQDSFGPLSRVAVCTRDDVTVRFVYG